MLKSDISLNPLSLIIILAGFCWFTNDFDFVHLDSCKTLCRLIRQANFTSSFSVQQIHNPFLLTKVINTGMEQLLRFYMK